MSVYTRLLAPDNTLIFTVVNDHKEDLERKIFHWKRGTAEEEIIENLACGIKTIVPTDSQGEAEAWNANFEQYPAAKSSESTGKLVQKNGLKTCKKIPKKHRKIQPDFWFTPSLGLASPDTKYFQSMIAMFFAVVEPTACQMMVRVRDSDIPRMKEFNQDVQG